MQRHETSACSFANKVFSCTSHLPTSLQALCDLQVRSDHRWSSFTFLWGETLQRWWNYSLEFGYATCKMLAISNLTPSSHPAPGVLFDEPCPKAIHHPSQAHRAVLRRHPSSTSMKPAFHHGLVHSSKFTSKKIPRKLKKYTQIKSLSKDVYTVTSFDLFRRFQSSTIDP